MISNIFEQKLEITGNTDFEKFTIKTPKEFKYVTRIWLINLTDCSNGCAAAFLTIADNGNEIIKNVLSDFFVFDNVTINGNLKNVLFPVNIRANENVFEIHLKSTNGLLLEAGQYRFVFLCENEPQEDFYYEQEKIINKFII